ncbi:hypothetical protein ACFY1S_01090 [Micromonospora sp. NPDC000663]|uniref:hypothetical protein n=1 Tax=Micromonospora sp. NPDC000663 TaxID=3364218 RepID=UPI0036CAA108
MAPVVDSVRQMVVLTPTAEFRAHQMARLPRASFAVPDLSDPERALRNRWARDELVTADAVAQAERLGVRVVRVDGTLGGDQLTDLVADHFAAYL